LLYPYAGNEIAQPPFRRMRLNLGANEACAEIVPNLSKKSTAVF